MVAHQLIPKVGIEVQGLTLPTEAICKTNLTEVKAGTPTYPSLNIT